MSVDPSFLVSSNEYVFLDTNVCAGGLEVVVALEAFPNDPQWSNYSVFPGPPQQASKRAPEIPST